MAIRDTKVSQGLTFLFTKRSHHYKMELQGFQNETPKEVFLFCNTITFIQSITIHTLFLGMKID